MVKKVAKAKKELSLEEQKQNRLLDVLRNLYLIPEPTYRFSVGDRVTIGNLKDVYISAIHNDHKIYEIDYTSIDNNYGKPITNEHQWMYVKWVDIRAYLESESESLLKNTDIRLNYTQTTLSGLLNKAYSFGINFEPEYQREFVWNLEDKVSLIDSIFNNVDIGKFTFIYYESEQWQETGFSYEILDGKQRLRAILDYYEDRFKYKGKLFSELSHRDRWHFESYGVVNAEAHNITKEQILRYFIMLNTGGRIMAKEQIDKVRGMLENSEEDKKCLE